MTDKQYHDIQRILLNNDIIGTSLIVGSYSETLKLIFSNGEKLYLSAFSENPNYRGYLEPLEIKDE